MRTGWIALGLMVGLGLAAPALAQQNLGSAQVQSMFTGVNPRNITFTPIDTSKAFKQLNSQVIRFPSSQPPFSLSNLFRSMPILSWPPRLGVSSPPAQAGGSTFTRVVPRTPFMVPQQ